MKKLKYKIGQYVLKVGTDHVKYKIFSTIYRVERKKHIIEYTTEPNGTRFSERYIKPWSQKLANKQRKLSLRYDIDALKSSVIRLKEMLENAEKELHSKIVEYAVL